MRHAIYVFAALLLSLVLSGCAARPTLEDLEQQALVTGDWSAVESREGLIRRRVAARTSMCPEKQTQVCTELGADHDCYCVRPIGLN